MPQAVYPSLNIHRRTTSGVWWMTEHVGVLTCQYCRSHEAEHRASWSKRAMIGFTVAVAWAMHRGTERTSELSSGRSECLRHGLFWWWTVSSNQQTSCQNIDRINFGFCWNAENHAHHVGRVNGKMCPQKERWAIADIRLGHEKPGHPFTMDGLDNYCLGSSNKADQFCQSTVITIGPWTQDQGTLVDYSFVHESPAKASWTASLSPEARVSLRVLSDQRSERPPGANCPYKLQLINGCFAVPTFSYQTMKSICLCLTV